MDKATVSKAPIGASKKVINLQKVFHAICISLLVISLLFSVFRFPAVLPRTWQSIKDFFLSIGYYFTEVCGYYDVVKPTVNDIPPNAVEILPFDPLVFKAKLLEAWELFQQKQQMRAFISFLLQKIVACTPYISLIALLALGGIVLLKLIATSYNERFNEDTRALKRFKRFEDAVLSKIKYFFKEYVDFLKEHRRYWIYLLHIWGYNLNVATIAFEAVAYLFYLSVSLDFLHVLTQVAKLAMDLTVAIDFLPGFSWVIIGWIVFDVLRKWIGLKKLETYENRNRKFLREHPGALFLVGKQRAKKTSIITDMALSQDQEFRDEAKERLLKRDKQFPYFPWVNVDNFYKKGQAEHFLPTLEKHRRFIRRLELRFKYRERYEGTRLGEWVKYWNKKLYGYEYDNFLFDYDYKRFGLEHNDGLTMVSVFEAITNYIQQLYIYAAPTSLIFGNYSIRTDLKWEKDKLFPKYNGNFFKRKPQEVKGCSGYCHIGDMDFFRVKKPMMIDNPRKDGFEVGCMSVMEIAKERGNQVTNRGVKAEAEEANVRNDGFETNMKMQTHASTIDNYTYFRLLMDDQRPDSLGADNKDLSDIILIKDASKLTQAIPFFCIEKALGWVAGLFYDKSHLDEKENRGDNCLIMYLMRKLFTPIFHFIERRENKYSVYTANLRTTDGLKDEVIADADKYYLCKAKVYSKRFATDGIKSFYSKKARRSKVGLNDMPSFKDVLMNVDEMKETHSYFYKYLNETTGGDYKAVYEKDTSEGAA